MNKLAPPSVTPLKWDVPETEANEPNPDFLYEDWEPAHAYHNVRALCDLANLSVPQKDEICATIMGESEFKQKVEGRPNSNGTHDWGIVQVNDGTLRGHPMWIGAGAMFASVQEVLDNPEKCVKMMINLYKAGHIDWWIAHKSGSYKQYLDQSVIKGRLGITN